MEFDFLKQFENRMKNVGLYAILIKNSISKTTWKTLGFEEYHEQLNVLFAVLLFIMEQNLKDENCTIDDISNFIDNLNVRYLRKNLSYENSKELAEFIVNVILCDEGKAMYFKGYNYINNDYIDIHISFLSNEIIYVDDIRRTTYKLTDNGYSLLLSTLEIEKNLKLTIHEMIFKLHLDKAAYDKAVNDIKNIFSELKIQIQKMNDAMKAIRINALSYSVDEYKIILNDNLAHLSETSMKFKEYKQKVDNEIYELENQSINIDKFEDKQIDNLNNLKIISSYLNKSLDEQQKLLITHFDLKTLYIKELEGISQMSVVKRFNLYSEVYDKILSDVNLLKNIDLLFNPLLVKPIKKSYNINKAFQFQKPIKDKKIEEDSFILFDDEEFQEEQIKKKQAKLLQYKLCLTTLLNYITNYRECTLKQISREVSLDENRQSILIPTVEIFREVIIELLKNKYIDIDVIRKEKTTTIISNNYEFYLTEMILEIIDENIEFANIKSIYSYKLDDEVVMFSEVKSENQIIKTVKCSNICFEVERN